MVRIWAVTVVRDEADILGTTLQYLVDQGVDGILVADNGSRDGTQDVVAECDHAFLTSAPGKFRQGEQLTALAHQAGEEYQADWILPFDADELWCSHTGTLRYALNHAGAPAHHLPFFNHYPTGEDPDVDDPFDRMPWRWSSPNGHKMAVMYHPSLRIGRGAHQVNYHGSVAEEFLYVRHFPWRSLGQYRQKTARLKNVPTTLWRALAQEGDAGFEQFFFDDPSKCERSGWPPGSLIYDPWRVINNY